ncbi:MAG: exodeoxyribonuclease VII small subunit [Planctomycetota bacterium]
MDTPKEPSFEQSLAELEELVARLEAGNAPLDESLALYENGVAALKRCHAVLDKAEKKIRMLVQQADGGAALREIELPRPAQGADPVGGVPAGLEVGPAGGAGGVVAGEQKAGTESRKARKRPGIDTQPPLRKNGGAPEETGQRPENPRGGAGGSLFGGSQ